MPSRISWARDAICAKQIAVSHLGGTTVRNVVGGSEEMQLQDFYGKSDIMVILIMMQFVGVCSDSFNCGS